MPKYWPDFNLDDFGCKQKYLSYNGQNLRYLQHPYYTATASNDKKQAWKQLSDMKESDGECLILLVPGDHPVVQYVDTIENKQIDLFDNLSPDSSVG